MLDGQKDDNIHYSIWNKLSPWYVPRTVWLGENASYPCLMFSATWRSLHLYSLLNVFTHPHSSGKKQDLHYWWGRERTWVRGTLCLPPSFPFGGVHFNLLHAPSCKNRPLMGARPIPCTVYSWMDKTSLGCPMRKPVCSSKPKSPISAL